MLGLDGCMAGERYTNIRLHDIRVLAEIKGELDVAARMQPCPACKHDMEQLSLFLELKISSIKNRSAMNAKTARIVKELNYINELSNLGIFLSKVLKPIIKLGAFHVPTKYKAVLNNNRKANVQIREHLLCAKLMATKLKGKDIHYADVSKVLESFIKATEFKLNADSETFFLFDKLIRFGYRAHLLGFAGKAITGAKGVVSCCMNQ